MDQSPVAGAPRHPSGGGVFASLAGRDEQFHGPPDHCGVLLQRDPLLQLDQSLVTLGDNSFGNLAGQFRGGGAGTLGVLEGERTGEPGRGDHVEGGLEILLRLPRETDDEVGGDRGVRDGGTYPLDDAQVALGPVGPAHRPQNTVGAGLQRHVQRRAHVGRLGHRVDDVVGELRRVR